MQGLIISSLSQLYGLKEKVFWIPFLKATATLLPTEICTSSESSDNGNTNGVHILNTKPHAVQRNIYHMLDWTATQNLETLTNQITKYEECSGQITVVNI